MHCEKLYNLHKITYFIVALFVFEMDKILSNQMLDLGKNIFWAMANASGPESRTIAMAPTPGAVDIAAIVSSWSIGKWLYHMAKALEIKTNAVVVSHIVLGLKFGLKLFSLVLYRLKMF